MGEEHRTAARRRIAAHVPDDYVHQPTTRKIEVVSDKCGTNAGYRRHLRAGERTCQPCRDAHAAENRRTRT